MSNNLMWLVNKRLGRRVAIAKYYPETGWYALTEPAGLYERMNEALDEENGDAIGPTDWALEYDIYRMNSKTFEQIAAQIAMEICEATATQEKEWAWPDDFTGDTIDRARCRAHNISSTLHEAK